MTNVLLRAGWLFLPCIHLAGCVEIAAFAVSQTAIEMGVYAGLSAGFAVPEALERKHCDGPMGNGVTVADVEGDVIPTDGEDVQVFEPAVWQPTLTWQGRIESTVNSDTLEGLLAVSAKSVLFVPPKGTPGGFSIPCELILNVEIRERPVRALVIKSCWERFDIFTFWQRQPRALDSKAAAAKLKERIVAFRTTTARASERHEGAVAPH